MEDRDIAIRALALDESPVTLGEARSYLDQFGEKFDAWMAMEHSGDCTSQPWSCCRCMAEGALKSAAIYRDFFNIPAGRR